MKELTKNYASDERFAAEVYANLMDIFKQVKSNRDEREDVWQRSYRAWSVDRLGSDKNYSGIADIDIPQLRKEVETMTRRIYKGLFPEDYLSAEGGQYADEDLAMANTQLVRHYLDNVIVAKRAFMPWIKQNVIYGSSPARTYWDKKTNEIIFAKRKPFVDKDGIIRFKRDLVKEEITLYNAPRIRTEDLFKTWVYPWYALTPEDIQITFWESAISKEDLKIRAKQGMVHNFEGIKDQGSDRMFVDEESQERLQQFGETGMYLGVQGNTHFKFLEIHLNLKLPDTETAVPCVVEILNDSYITRIQRNGYWHQSSPFDWMRFILPPPGEFYGRGLPEATLKMQNTLNDTANQTMDATTLSLNNITVINPAYAPNDESFEIEPGAKWWADPAAIKQFQFPDLTDTGYKAIGALRSMISELSDNQPQLPDPIAGKARSTGQAQLAINEWQTDLFVILEMITLEAMNPLAYKIHSLIQQNVEEDDVIKISGKYFGTWVERIITPEQIIGRYMFKWNGALQIENQSIKTQQLLNFLKVYSAMPPEVQGRVKLVWENIILKLLRDGFLIKDVHNVIETSKIKASISPDIENKMFAKGLSVSVAESDDDAAHLTSHDAAYKAESDPLKRYNIGQHIRKHQEQVQRKVQEMQMAQLAMAAAQGQAAPGEGQAAPELSETTEPDDLERGLRGN